MAARTPRKRHAPSSVRLLGLRAESVSSAVELGPGFVVTLVKVGSKRLGGRIKAVLPMGLRM